MLTWALVGALILFAGLTSIAFAQTGDLASVLENAEKSLQTKKNNTSTSDTSDQFVLPPNANLGARFKLTPDDIFENRFNVPSKSSFNFSSGSVLCPRNPCQQEFFDGVFRNESFAPNKYFFAGTLKIEDKTAANNADIKSWLYYPFDGEFLIKSIKENIKTGNTVEVFTGQLGLDKGESKYSDHDIQYSVTGTFEQPSNILTLVGRSS